MIPAGRSATPGLLHNPRQFRGAAMTLIAFVALYLLASVAIGLYAASRVKNTADYAVAGRSLPLIMIVTTTFATWFGSETVLGIPSKFIEGGMRKTVEDPFGASFCLIFVGMFFAAKLYRMNLLTIGDFYRQRYGRGVEIFSAAVILISYLGWVAAQITALGLVFSLLSGGAITITNGMILGTVIVFGYTVFGGMWSVALTDFFQMIIIVVGLSLIAWFAADLAGGADKVVAYAAGKDMFRFLPESTPHDWLFWLGAAITIMIGSIPQQDVFQRVTSAKDEKTAIRGCLIGGGVYFCFAFVPIFIAYAALMIEPEYAKLFASEDAREIQRILPNLILERTPLWAQVLFFGALLSAILSTASGALIAPTALFTENVLRPLAPRMGDKQFLLLLRASINTDRLERSQ
jgi:Na+/proline symporter